MNLHVAAGDIHQPYKLYCKFVKIHKDWHASDGCGKLLANEKKFPWRDEPKIECENQMDWV